MLDVDGGDHIDAGVQEFLDVLPSFVVLAARDVGMGELVNQDHLRMACQHRRYVELEKAAAAILGVTGRDDLDALSQLRDFPAAVSLDHTRHQIDAALQPPVRLSEHGVRLTDAGGRTHVDAQLSAFAGVVDDAHVNIIHQMCISR